MSFKVKRWASRGQISISDYDPDVGYTGTQAVRSFVFPISGKFIFLNYKGLDGVYYIYDPVGPEWSGPWFVESGWIWGWWSAFYGPQVYYTRTADEGIFGYGGSQDQWSGNHTCVSIDKNFVLTRYSAPSYTGMYNSTTRFHPGMGITANGLPSRLASTMYKVTSGDPWRVGINSIGPGGTRAVADRLLDEYAWTLDPIDHQIYWSGQDVGPYISWSVNDDCSNPAVEDHSNLFLSPPAAGGGCAGIPVSATATRVFVSGDVYGWVDNRLGGLPGVMQWAKINEDPLTEVAIPWTSTWNLRQMQLGGGYDLYQGDIDGVDHEVLVPIVGVPTYVPGLGLFMGSNIYGEGGASITPYFMDPYQPTGLAPRAANLGVSAIGWAGEVAIRPNLRVEDVLPADRLNPQGMGGSVVERVDGKHTNTGSAICIKTNRSYTNLDLPLTVDVSSYPVTDPDFVWPGAEDGIVEGMGFMSFTEGPDGKMIWGGMPDPSWGMYSIVPGWGWLNIWMGAGYLLEENLGGVPTYSLRESSRISATNSAMQPMPANYVGAKDQLIGFPDFPGGPIVCFCQACPKGISMPFWKALVWRISEASVWTKILDWQDIGPPGLGESNWTVWSIAPIYACAALPQGGFLIGATLYFDPWVEGEWEDTPGARLHTFMGTGKGWVPSKPGWAGPFEIENSPRLLTAEPLSAGRSLYGPDALLVYDHNGTFVTHLNTPEVYPPDGRSILVTKGAVPRVIFKTYKEGSYSDYAEGWGAWFDYQGDGDLDVPMFVSYDLMSPGGLIRPGMGKFNGFLDLSPLGPNLTDPASKWGKLTSLYGYYSQTHPQTEWGGAGTPMLRLGRGGRMITPLGSRNPSSRQGTKGVGQRS